MNSDQVFYATRHEPIVSRAQVAAIINKQSRENRDYNLESNGSLVPVLNRELTVDDGRLTDTLCAGLADTMAITIMWNADEASYDERVVNWSHYLDGIIGKING